MNCDVTNCSRWLPEKAGQGRGACPAVWRERASVARPYAETTHNGNQAWFPGRIVPINRLQGQLKICTRAAFILHTATLATTRQQPVKATQSAGAGTERGKMGGRFFFPSALAG